MNGLRANGDEYLGVPLRERTLPERGYGVIRPEGWEVKEMRLEVERFRLFRDGVGDSTIEPRELMRSESAGVTQRDWATPPK